MKLGYNHILGYNRLPG
ncbi:hypothetical protein FWK35_00036164 [Aphis craccivora]|uniref:Uncharacterized protein n=1 Tax=Aphis craccivora TaxID=307492 RepID=A0A6G0VM00_APHCR|nr:hypothetical protein FWK35_00036164 [Aphis craccivora]